MIQFFKIINLLGPPNCKNGSRVTAIQKKKNWILPIGGALAVEGLQLNGLPRLV